MTYFIRSARKKSSRGFLRFAGKCITLRRYEWNFFHIYDVNANATLSCILSFVFDSQTEFFRGRFPKLTTFFIAQAFALAAFRIAVKLCRYTVCRNGISRIYI